MHHVQHLVSHMLQRNVHIPTHLRIRGHLVEHIFREISRIRIMHTQPLYTVNLRQPLEQLSESTPVIQVQSVISGVLSYQHQLPDALRSKHRSLLHQFLDRHRTMRPPDERNRAIRTAPVTPLRNLQISVRQFLARPHTLSPPIRMHLHAESLHDRINVPRPEPSVHFRNQCRHIRNVTL